jgi:hypothetical protein
VPEEDDGGLGTWGWLLLIGLLTGLVALLVTNRSRKVAAWDGEARGLAGETRTVLGVRLPPILTTVDPVQRSLAWPPVRDDLTSLAARWAALLETAPDGERQAYASRLSGIIRDLVDAADAENEAIAAGRDWRMLRPRLDAVVGALTAALEPTPVPAAYPAPPVQPAPGPPPVTSTYGEPLDDEPAGGYPPPRHASPDDGRRPDPGDTGRYGPPEPGY